MDDAAAVPQPTPETQAYWEGAAAGELRIQRCRACERPYFFPRPVCPDCGSGDVEWIVASGDATLYSYTISARPMPGHPAPFVIAVVELDEGPRMLTNLVDVEPSPEALELDMPLKVRFVPRGDFMLPVFAPAVA